MDFDVAKTFPTKGFLDQDLEIRGPKPVQSCEWDIALLEDFGDALVRTLLSSRVFVDGWEEDQKEGLPPNTKFY
ncbi:hypothetical protein N7478_001899 [Penicillium angulare]|uniref:uncharacterized protein n=1 Tax=Penicillium angulare TaxID=116970 RepID=UPI0025415D03|nr:uncharacterized protein N7478_001899 [Penicillium angulare]KAJ5288869.1 hypothetical protein N7478_001899 [Penicillium angulare]